MPIFPSGAFQYRPLPRQRDPSSLRAREVCPHCKRELVEYRFCADGVTISTGVVRRTRRRSAHEERHQQPGYVWGECRR